MVVWSSCSLLVMYLLFLKWISFRSHRYSLPTVEDYFLVNRSIAGPLLWATIIATVVNSLAFTAVPGLVYSGGVLFAQMWVVVLVLPLLIRLFGPTISRLGRKHSALTQAELYGRIYDSPGLAVLCAIIGILSVFPFLIIQLSAIAKVTVVASEGLVSYETAIVVFAFSTALYLFFGGSRAVVWTDVVQGCCFGILLLASAVLFSYWVGGLPQAISQLSQARPQLFSFNETTWSLFVNNALSWPFAFFFWPQLFQRMLMARDEPAVRQASKATLLLFALVMSCILTIGLTASAAFSSSSIDADTLIAQMYARYLPIGASFLVLAVVASGMSTVDSGLLAISSTIQCDLLPKLFHQRQFYSARVISVTAIFLLACIALSDLGRGAIAPLVTVGASLATLLLWPLLGLYFGLHRSPRAMAVVVVAGATAVFASIGGPSSVFLPVGPGVAGFVTSALAFAGVGGIHCMRVYSNKNSGSAACSQIYSHISEYS